MKSTRLMLTLVLLWFANGAFAQSDAHKHPAESTPQPPTEAQQSFTALKALAGNWEGHVKLDTDAFGKPGDDAVRVTMRITSRGNALVHEMQDPKSSDDPVKYDHPVTMFYLDEGRLLLTHYCDAGNRPRMTAKLLDNGKKIEFEFLDVAGGNSRGHMHHGVFTIIDANHHTEDWTYMMPGDKPVHAHLELQRVAGKEIASR